MTSIRRLAPDDLPWLRKFWKDNWGDECHIVSLNSQREGQGVGTKLIGVVAMKHGNKNVNTTFSSQRATK